MGEDDTKISGNRLDRINKTFGSWIQNRRNAAQMTLSELSGEVGLNAGQLHRLETGETKISIALLIAISEIVRADPTDIIRELFEPREKTPRDIRLAHLKAAEAERTVPRITPPLYKTIPRMKTWYFLSPEGTRFRVENISKWVQENRHLFHPDDAAPGYGGDPSLARATVKLRTLRPDSLSPRREWYGWTWDKEAERSDLQSKKAGQ